MKLNKLLLLAAVAVGLAACNNDDSEVPQPVKTGEGNTFAGMVISTNTKTRATTQGDDAGLPQESTMGSLKMVSSAGNVTWTAGTVGTPAPGKFWETANGSKTYLVSPWKTQDGTQEMGLIFNEPATLVTSSQYDVYEAKTLRFGGQTNPIEDIATFSTPDKFVLTSAIATKQVKKDISETDVKGAGNEDETKNVFPFEVERVVAQGKVAKADGLSGETSSGDGTVDLASLKYAAINGAVTTYVFGDNAGDRVMIGTKQYKDFKSYIDDKLPTFSDGQNTDMVKPFLVRLGNLGKTTNEELGGYKAIDVLANEAAAKTTAGIYFFENSVNEANMTPANKDYGFYRLAYAKVYATFVPKKVYKLDGEEQAELNPEPITDWKSGTTFYKGAEDGLFYATKEAAKHSLSHPGQAAFTYTNGKCAYRVLWNRRIEEVGTGGDKKVFVRNADTRRNNIYLVSIAGFKSIGMPWDSSDPSDPNLPKPAPDPEDPENPDPEQPDNPDIEKQDTYMRVVGKILPWNLVKRSEILE